MSATPYTKVEVSLPAPLARRARDIAATQSITLQQLVREILAFITDEVNQVGHVASSASRLASYREAFEVNRAALSAAFDQSMTVAKAAADSFMSADSDAGRFTASCQFDQAYRVAAKIAGATVPERFS